MPTGIGTGLLLSSIIGGGSSIIGGALSNKSKTSGQQSGTTMPAWNPAYTPLQGQVLSMVQKRLSSDPDLSGYQSSGISGINSSYGNAKAASDANLTRRGLASSPLAGVVDSMRENSRTGSIASFRNSIPLLSRELQTQDLGLAGNVLAQGRGSTSTGTGSQMSESGGGAAGAFDNLAGYLGYLQGSGAFQNGGVTGKRYTPYDLGY